MNEYLNIKLDLTKGEIVEVTDYKGERLNMAIGQGTPEEVGYIERIDNITVMQSRRNPQCRWVYFNGVWYWICS